MIQFDDIDKTQLRVTPRMIGEEATGRGWGVAFYYVGSSMMELTRPDGTLLTIYSATPPTATYAAAHRANDKYCVAVQLQDNGIPTPATVLIRKDEYSDETVDAALRQMGSAVVKPLDAGHGNGVTVGVRSLEAAKQAISVAGAFSSGILLQKEYADRYDLRLTYIDGELVGALLRTAAHVIGDGTHTLRELIQQENQNPLRGESYRRALNVIPEDRALEYLGDKAELVPAEGTYVPVIGTANLGTGGTTEDITDVLPSELVELGRRTAALSGLPVCGVDFLVAEKPAESVDYEALDPVVLEVNKCPALFMHETPTAGAPRPAISKYVDYLARI